MAINRTTDTTIIAIQQINNRTEVTQINNHVDIVIEQITNPRIVKPVLIAEDWDICLANVEHHDKIMTIGNKNRMATKTREVSIKHATQILLSNKIFKLGQSTSQGQHVDDTNEGPLTQLLTAVVDHRSLYVQISILNKLVEAVCDSGASVSCLAEKFFNQINESHQVIIQPCTTRLSSANQMPIQIKGTVSVSIKIGPKTYEHTYYVLIEAASDCLLGLDFLETNICDALFSEGKLKIDRNTLVLLCGRCFNGEVLTIYKDTTVGSSQLVSDCLIQEINRKQMNNYNEVEPKYDLENVKKANIKVINNNCRADFRNLIHDYSDIFSINQWDHGKCDATNHRIDVKPGSQPIKLPNKRMPVHYKDDLKEKIDAFMTKELITPCHSPYSAPAMLIPKKNGKLRLVIDYRKLNEHTIKSCWPIPSIEEISDTLQGGTYFTTIDISWGFYQLPMEPQSQNYTTFSTPS